MRIIFPLLIATCAPSRAFVTRLTGNTAALLLIGFWTIPLRASIFSPPTETSTARNALSVVEAEISQNHPAEAVKRADLLIKDHAADLIPMDDHRLLSTRHAVIALLQQNRAKLQDEYDRQFATASWQMLAAAKQLPNYQPPDLYLISRRYPLSPAAAQALVDASKRATELGDEPTSAALSPSSIFHPPFSSIPFPANWYANPESMPLPKYLPAASGGSTIISTPRALLSFNDAGNLNWQWSMPRPWVESTPVDHFSDIGRGTLLSPALLLDSTSTPRIIVVRQLLSSMREFGLRAFRASDGKLLWASESDPTLSGMIFVGEPTIAGRYVYALALQDSSTACYMIMVALDVMTGRTLWQAIVGVRPDNLKGENRQAVDRAAEDFWQSSAPLVDRDQLIVTPNCAYIVSLDRFTGEIRWLTPYTAQPPTAEDIRKYRALRFAGKHPALPMSQAQALRWNAAAVATPSAIVVAPQDTAVAMALDRATGKVLWSSPDLVAPILIASFDNLAIFTGDNIAAIDAATAQLRWHYMPLKGTTINGPPALRGQFLYVPTTKGTVALSASDGTESPTAPPAPNLQKLLANPLAKKALEDAGALRWLSP